MRGRRAGQRHHHRAAGLTLRILIAVVAAIILLRIGIFFLRSLAQGVPEPPPPGELRRMDRRYRCSVCGAELRLVIAPDQDPVPPRHCMEEMDLIADRDE